MDLSSQWSTDNSDYKVLWNQQCAVQVSLFEGLHSECLW